MVAVAQQYRGRLEPLNVDVDPAGDAGLQLHRLKDLTGGVVSWKSEVKSSDVNTALFHVGAGVIVCRCSESSRRQSEVFEPRGRVLESKRRGHPENIKARKCSTTSGENLTRFNNHWICPHFGCLIESFPGATVGGLALGWYRSWAVGQHHRAGKRSLKGHSLNRRCIHWQLLHR